MSPQVTRTLARLRRLGVLLCVFAVTVCAHSQSPTSLTGTLTITNPTNQLADYSNPIGNQLALNLTAPDPEFGNRTVRLKLYIEQGNTLYASGTDVVVGASNLTLPLNALQRFNSTQLAPYFRLDNLQGLSAQTYQSGLPEGLYRFTFEVIDASATAWNGTVLGRISEQFWVTLNDPPLLNAPSNGENMAVVTTSAGINFGWIPRWTSTNTRYVFTLVDLGLNSNSANWYQQFMSLESVPLYRSTPLSAALLSFGASAGFPTLIAGRTYGWRVQATGGAFKNNGYSEIFVFNYSGTCAQATGLTATAQGSDAIAVRWNASGVHSSYRVQYRKRGTGDANTWRWFETTTTNNFVTLAPLEANTTYEIKLGGVCASDVVSYGTVIPCQTAAITSNPNCGQPVSLNITNTAPLASLRINDTIRAAEIPICVTKVSGANGVFTGEGFGKLPWLGETKIKVKFTGIGINSDKKLISGNVETVYDRQWGNITDVDEYIQNLKDLVSALTELFFTSIDTDYAYFKALRDALLNYAESELPQGLKDRLTTALNNMEQAKKEYDAAKALCENLPEGPEKTQACQKMDAAKAKYLAAQQELNAIKAEKDRLVSDVAGLVIQAIKQLRQEYVANQGSLQSNFNNAKATVVQQVFTNQNIATTASTSQEIWMDRGGWDEEVIETGLNPQLRSFATVVKNMNDKGALLRAIKYIIAMDTYYASNDKVSNGMGDDTILEGKSLLRQTMEKKIANVSNADIISFIKNYLTEKLKQM